MKNFIFGAGGHCKSILSTAQVIGIKINGILNVNQRVEKILGYNVFNEASHDWTEDNSYFIAISNMEIKKNLLKKIKSKVRTNNYFNIIHHSAVISPSAKLGYGVCVLANSFIGPDVKIGNHVCINTNCVIEHDCVIGDNTFLAPSVSLAGNVKIGENVFLGINSTVINDLYICSNTTIGASSLVINNLFKGYQTLVGVPAKII